MKIRLLKPQLVGQVNHSAGDVVDVDEYRAKRMVEAGAAAKFVMCFPEPARPETATAKPELETPEKPKRK